MSQRRVLCLIALSVALTACQEPSSPPPDVKQEEQAQVPWTRDLIVAKLKAQGWKAQHLKTQEREGDTQESFLVSKGKTQGALTVSLFPTHEKAMEAKQENQNATLLGPLGGANVVHNAAFFQTSMTTNALADDRAAGELLTALTGVEVPPPPKRTPKPPPKLPEFAPLPLLRSVQERPWDKKTVVAWRFQKPLTYSVAIHTKTPMKGELKELKVQASLGLTPQPSGATVALKFLNPPGPEQKETMDRFGTKLAGQEAGLVDFLVPILFPTSHVPLDPTSALTKELVFPIKLGTHQGQLHGQARTTLQRAVTSGKTTLLELRTKITIDTLKGPEPIQKMKGSKVEGEAIVYYDPKAKRFTYGNAHLFSAINWGDTSMASLLEQTAGNATQVQGTHYQYELVSP